MNAKQLKELIHKEVHKHRKEIQAAKEKEILDEHRTDLHYVLDQASKGKSVSEEV